jgi:hypothetical protein
VSNIFTSFLRIVPRPGRRIGRGEAEDIVGSMLRRRGSYNVPVAVRRADGGRLLDVQVGSAKNGEVYDFWYRHPDRYACVWERFYNDGGDRDTITHYGPDGDTDHGAFWYGFDEVRVVGAAAPPSDLGAPPLGWEPDGTGVWRAAVAGRHRTGNDRTDVDGAGPCATEVEWAPPVLDAAPGGLVTPSTPAYYHAELVRIEPEGLRRLLERGGPGSGHPRVERVELLWRGRVVRRARLEHDAALADRVWEQRSADDWDNCLHPEYLASMRAHGL